MRESVHEVAQQFTALGELLAVLPQVVEQRGALQQRLQGADGEAGHARRAVRRVQDEQQVALGRATQAGEVDVAALGRPHVPGPHRMRQKFQRNAGVQAAGALGGRQVGREHQRVGLRQHRLVHRADFHAARPGQALQGRRRPLHELGLPQWATQVLGELPPGFFAGELVLLFLERRRLLGGFAGAGGEVAHQHHRQNAHGAVGEVVAPHAVARAVPEAGDHVRQHRQRGELPDRLFRRAERRERDRRAEHRAERERRGRQEVEQHHDHQQREGHPPHHPVAQGKLRRREQLPHECSCAFRPARPHGPQRSPPVPGARLARWPMP